MVRISRADRVAIEWWIANVQPTLKIADWRIDLKDDPPDNPEAAACMNTRTGQFVAALWLGDKWFSSEYDDAWRTQTLLHELVHIHFEDAWDYVDTLCEAELGNQASNLAKWVFKMKMEKPLDQIAYSLAEIVPVFKLPSGRTR